MTDELLTPRLRMRRATMNDLPAVHAMLTDVPAMRYWSSLPHTDLAQTETWLQSMVDANPAESDDYLLEKDGEVIGKLGCWKLPEIGFLIRSNQWGQGLAGEAMTAFLAHRRAIGSPPQIVADVDPRNAASLALLSRHGFVETGRAAGTWQVGDELCDSIYLALDF